MSNEMFNISKLLEKHIVYVPEIQRDYVHGRDNAESVRKKLLEDIYKVLHGEKKQHILNYIYGVPKGDGRIILIDGQQRVTTLFLLKWYLAVKSGADLAFLGHLDYATRDSSQKFCEFLKKNGNCIKDKEVPSEAIKNHMDFKKRWLNDPTIVNMLNMLDAIDKQKNDDPSKLYGNIDNIKFSFKLLNGFKRTDELYVAMNARGKQLTSFELIKSELLKKDSSLAAKINGKWLPTFWELAKSYAGEDDDQEKYASENYDSFLYNYYSFIVQMIWWCKHPEGDRLPSVVDMTKGIVDDESSMKIIIYAMDLVKTKLSEHNFDFENDLKRNTDKLPIDKDKVVLVLFDGQPEDSIKFFDLCCRGAEEFTQAGRCYLWAYIRYYYDKSQENVANGRELKDYYVLMRALYMREASYETPTRVDEFRSDEKLIRNIVVPFEGIIRNDQSYKESGEYRSQYNAFFNGYKRKYEVLNNCLVRGVTDNIWGFTDDELAGILADILKNDELAKIPINNLTDDELSKIRAGDLTDDKLKKNLADNLADNLQWLWETNELVCFKQLALCGFSNLKCEVNGYFDRIFLPFTKMMLKSVFSFRGWSKSNDFKKLYGFLLLHSLKSLKVQIDNPYPYSVSDWEYYYIKYESFRDSIYGQFQLQDKNQRMSFNAKRIKNRKINKTYNPFLYEIYRVYKGCNGAVSYNNYIDYIDQKKLSFEETDGQLKWTYGNNPDSYTFDETKDYIEEMIEKINELECQPQKQKSTQV